jgi:FKBP-type peptidyl-prolyl cis-trans isomerase FklB
MSIELKNETDKLGYALAMNVVGSMMQLPVEFNREIFVTAINDLVSGGQPALPPQEYQQIMQDFQQKLQNAGQAELKEVAGHNASEAKAFLNENRKKDGIKETATGLQYEVLTEGNGAAPVDGQKVRVHYEGTLLSGQMFDSSVKRGQPAEFGLNQVIAGWTEGLKLMKKGAKCRFFIPPALAYGERGAGEVIPPNAALIFEVELLEIL